jgi:hypothetical protein
MVAVDGATLLVLMALSFFAGVVFSLVVRW